MSAEIWFFYTLDGKSEITVLNRESACNIVRLLSPQARTQWKVRRNRSSTAHLVSECAELLKEIDGHQPASVPLRTDNRPLHLESATTVKPAPQPVAAVAKKGPPAAQPIKLEKTHDSVSIEVSNVNDLPPPQIFSSPVHEDIVRENSRAQQGASFHAKGSERRRHARHDMRLRVLVISGSRSFRTFSRNVSRSGLMLEHVVPAELMGQNCRVIIGSADLKENIEFDAVLRGDPQNPRAVEFVEGKADFLRRLESWIETVSGSGTARQARG